VLALAIFDTDTGAHIVHLPAQAGGACRCGLPALCVSTASVGLCIDVELMELGLCTNILLNLVGTCGLLDLWSPLVSLSPGLVGRVTLIGIHDGPCI